MKMLTCNNESVPACNEVLRTLMQEDRIQGRGAAEWTGESGGADGVGGANR